MSLYEFGTYMTTSWKFGSQLLANGGCTSGQSRRQLLYVRGSTKSARLIEVTAGREDHAHCEHSRQSKAYAGIQRMVLATTSPLPLVDSKPHDQLLSQTGDRGLLLFLRLSDGLYRTARI